MSKKTQSAGTHTRTIQSRIQSITRWVEENQNLVYIAVIVFCLSVTILYKITQWDGS